jgi:hypothetical protein
MTCTVLLPRGRQPLLDPLFVFQDKFSLSKGNFIEELAGIIKV